ncbi:MAG: hypothetical protein F6K28_30040 [Microcoleus sp. SIO2G3]|nr:hypothetical protein [Microcoleus sp. SIO2G3]
MSCKRSLGERSPRCLTLLWLSSRRYRALCTNDQPVHSKAIGNRIVPM